jgi:hypothetical protein
MTSHEDSLQLYDIRKGESSSKASVLSSSLIWSPDFPREAHIGDFSNDFQIAILYETDILSLVDLHSNPMTSLYTLPPNEYRDMQMTYDYYLMSNYLRLFRFLHIAISLVPI